MRRKIRSSIAGANEGIGDITPRQQAVNQISKACGKELQRWKDNGSAPLSKKGAKRMVNRAMGNTSQPTRDLLLLCFDDNGNGTYTPLENMHEGLVVLMKV